MSSRIESTDNLRNQVPNSADGWAAQLVADRNNYQKGTHQKQYQHDLAMAQSFVHSHFGNLEITGTQDGHLVGKNSNDYYSLTNDAKVAMSSPADGQWQKTGSGHLAKISPDGSGLYQVGQNDSSGESVAKSILKDRGMTGADGADPSPTQIANFQRDLLLANGRKVNDADWFRHLKPGQVIKLPAGQRNRSDSPLPAPATYLPFGAPDVQPSPAPADVPAAAAATDLPPAAAMGISPADVGHGNKNVLTPQLGTNAATMEREAKDASDSVNRTLDAATDYLQQQYGDLGLKGYNRELIEAALDDKTNAPNPIQRQGLELLRDNFAKVQVSSDGTAPLLNNDSVERLKSKFDAAIWTQAGKNCPDLAGVMQQAHDAYKQFAEPYGDHTYLTIDKINGLLSLDANGDRPNVEPYKTGLQFLQNNFTDMKRGNPDIALLLGEVNSWTDD